MEILSVSPAPCRRSLERTRNFSGHRIRDVAALCLLALVLDGCRGGPSPLLPPRNSIQFSPNAEPLSGGPLGHPKCEEALAGWFERTDANHDGVIDRDEFMSDARRQFERMDIHHAGYVTALDLSEFRAPYEAPIGDEGTPPGNGLGPSGSGGRRGPGGDIEAGGGRGNQQRNSSVDTRADPVMSADKTLSFKVTLADFLAQANDIFATLDRNHDGRVVKDAVIAGCKPEAQKKE